MLVSQRGMNKFQDMLRVRKKDMEMSFWGIPMPLCDIKGIYMANFLNLLEFVAMVSNFSWPVIEWIKVFQ